MINPAFEILNQRGTPMFFSDTLANRPAAAIVGRIFISTDTFDLYRDTGTTWDLLSPSTAGITGSGTPFKYPVFDAATNITDGSIEQFTNENVSTKNFFIETSTDDGYNQTTLKLTNRYFGTPDTLTIEYGRTILAGAPFLRIQDNFATYPTSKILFGNGLLDIQDTTFSVNNSLSNDSYFYGVDPNLNIVATGSTNNATLTLAGSLGAYSGIIRTGSPLNNLRFQTGANLNRLTIGSDGYANFTYILSVGTTLGSSTFNAVRTAIDTLSRANSVAAFGFGETGSNNGILIQANSSSPFGVDVQACNSAVSTFYPLFLNPLGGQIVIGGTTIQAGYEFNIVGDTYFNGTLFGTATSVEFTGTGATASTSVLRLYNSASAIMWNFQNGGRVFIGSAGNAGPLISPITTSATATISGTNLYFQSGTTTEAATFGVFNFSLATNMSQTTGAQVGIQTNISFAPTSGTASYSGIRINHGINQTGGANGITRGIYVNPVITAAADYRGIETSIDTGVGFRYQAYFGGNAPIFFGSLAHIQFSTAAAGGTQIGTASNQKFSFWGATTIIQPNTSVASATIVSPGGGVNLKTDDTFDGYTIAQVVKALRNTGLLA